MDRDTSGDILTKRIDRKNQSAYNWSEIGKKFIDNITWGMSLYIVEV